MTCRPGRFAASKPTSVSNPPQDLPRSRSAASRMTQRAVASSMVSATWTAHCAFRFSLSAESAAGNAAYDHFVPVGDGDRRPAGLGGDGIERHAHPLHVDLHVLATRAGRAKQFTNGVVFDVVFVRQLGVAVLDPRLAARVGAILRILQIRPLGFIGSARRQIGVLGLTAVFLLGDQALDCAPRQVLRGVAGRLRMRYRGS